MEERNATNVITSSSVGTVEIARLRNANAIGSVCAPRSSIFLNQIRKIFSTKGFKKKNKDYHQKSEDQIKWTKYWIENEKEKNEKEKYEEAKDEGNTDGEECK